MKFVTVRCGIDAAGVVNWKVLTGIKMIECDFGKWYRGHSLLSFPLDLNDLDILDSRTGVVYDGKLYHDVHCDAHILQRRLKPHTETPGVYVALEIEATNADQIDRIESFSTRFARPEMTEQGFDVNDGRVSQIWQVQFGGGLLVCIDGRRWRVRCGEQSVTVVEDLSASQRIVAYEQPYSVDFGSLSRHQLLAWREALVREFYVVGDELCRRGWKDLSRYFTGPKIFGSGRWDSGKERDYSRGRRSRRTL
jgi:hypothetical protein